MVEIWLPYGQTEIPARVPEETLLDIIRPKNTDTRLNVQDEVKRQLGEGPFAQKAKQAASLCIAVGRSANKQIIDELVQSMITALLAAGVNAEVLSVIRCLGAPGISADRLPQIKLFNHDPVTSAVVPVEGFKGDFEAALNSNFVQSTVKLIIAELSPHNFFGSEGIYESVFPGFASAQSIMTELSERKGMEIQDISKERRALVHSISDIFALGFVADGDGALAKTTMGSMDECVQQLGPTLEQIAFRKLTKPADIVIVGAGGAPSDNTLAGAVEALPTALTCAKRDGVIIFAAECGEGDGDGSFYEWCAEKKEARYLEARLRHAFNYDGYKAAFLTRALENHRIYLVSTIPDHYVENTFRMRAAHTVNSALQTAQHSMGADSTILLIPNGNNISLSLAKPEDALLTGN